MLPFWARVSKGACWESSWLQSRACRQASASGRRTHPGDGGKVRRNLWRADQVIRQKRALTHVNEQYDVAILGAGFEGSMLGIILAAIKSLSAGLLGDFGSKLHPA